MDYVLGIDVSTTATKAVLINEAGTVAAVGVSGYDFQTPHPQWSEQDPELWWVAAQEAIRSALSVARAAATEIVSIGLTGQMHGLVLLDAAGAVLRPAILWNDQRTAAECDEIRDRIGHQRLIEMTGNDALTGFTTPRSSGSEITSLRSLQEPPRCCSPRTTCGSGSPGGTPQTRLGREGPA